MTPTSREQVKSINGTCVKHSHSISRTRSHGNNEQVRSGSGNENNRDNRPTTISESPSHPRLCSSAIRVAITLSILSLQVSDANVLQHSNVAAVTRPILDSDLSIGQIGEHGRSQAPGDIIAIKEGQDLDLSCPIVVQNEDLIISWTCNNEPANIRSSRIHVTDSGKLRIHSAKVGDSCNYRCEAADGFETFSVIIKVIIVDRHLMDQLTKRADKFDNSTSRLHSGSHQRSDPHGPTENKLLLTSQPDVNLGIEMQIEPSEVHLDKNKTFTLECKIKHAPNLVAPQIIWLKEYLGGHVDSLNEAFEKNLILIDGVYYHSLNWPRALSYSKQSSTANSALLVKQTNWLHSGRYICFAGYPASIMSLHLNNSLPNGPSSLNDQIHMRPPIRYKMAQAMVTIDDREGESAFKSSRSKNASDSTAPSQIWTYTSLNVTTLIFFLLMVCTSIAIVKFVALKKSEARKNLGKNLDSAINDSHVRSQTQGPTNPELHVAACVSDTDYVTGRQERLDLSHVPTNSLINDNNPLGERYKFDQALLSERLNCIDSTNGYSNNEHIYSEIGYRMTVNSNEEPYYKQPTRINK